MADLTGPIHVSRGKFHPTRDMPTKLAAELGVPIHGSDGTSYPFWVILIPRKTAKKRPTITELGARIVGVWLSRPSAERHLERRRYAYGSKAKVYCMSGCYSWDWKRLSDALRRPALTAELPDERGFLVEVPYNKRPGRGRYWKAERSGYAMSAVTAGVYTREEAEEICGRRDSGLKAVADPLDRRPGATIRLSEDWNDDPMLAAFQAGRNERTAAE